MFQSICMTIFRGAREQYFVQSLNWISFMYARCVFVQYAAICHYHRFVCVSGAAVWVRSGHRIRIQLSNCIKYCSRAP
jgi:hypothetical protein